jgi:hypothetical protein
MAGIVTVRCGGQRDLITFAGDQPLHEDAPPCGWSADRPISQPMAAADASVVYAPCPVCGGRVETGSSSVEAIADPLERQRAALTQLEYHREVWKREAGKWATIRAAAVIELKQGRTWAEVAELLGVSEPTAWNIAHPKVAR